MTMRRAQWRHLSASTGSGNPHRGSTVWQQVIGGSKLRFHGRIRSHIRIQSIIFVRLSPSIPDKTSRPLMLIG